MTSVVFTENYIHIIYHKEIQPFMSNVSGEL